MTEEIDKVAEKIVEKNFSLFGADMFGDDIIQKKNGVLAERFEFPPFSVLNARDGLWQDRKRAWINLGIKSEVGRGENMLYKAQEHLTEIMRSRLTYVKGNKPIEEMDEVSRKIIATQSGTSIFDPVVCELMYRWFCPEGGQVVDPFAGGSVRGVVAGLLGYKYHGIDLRPEQVMANEEQFLSICPDSQVSWVVGDSVEQLGAAPDADFIMSCPPYGNLERYSDDPRDLSTMRYSDFMVSYKKIIAQCVARLKPNCMACFVVADFRDTKNGMYHGFVADTIKAFQECGLGFYNDAILITAVGSLPIRAGRQFEIGRKLGKTHQNILVFKKY